MTAMRKIYRWGMLILVLCTSGAHARPSAMGFKPLTEEENRYLGTFVGKQLPLRQLLDQGFDSDYQQILSIGEPPSFLVWFVREQREGFYSTFLFLTIPADPARIALHNSARIVSFLPAKLSHRTTESTPQIEARYNCVDADGLLRDEKTAFSSNLQLPKGRAFIVMVTGQDAVILDSIKETLRTQTPPRQIFCAGDEITFDVSP